MGFAD